jgi:hypothetical protein
MQESSPSSDSARPDPPANAPPTAGAVPPGAERPAASAPSADSAIARSVAQIRRLTGVVWKYLGDVAGYYWGMREPLWEYVAGFAPNLMSESVRMREVRLAPYESHGRAEYDSNGWKATVPGRCVVCGEPTRNLPTDEVRTVADASRAFWAPVATWLTGAALGIVLWNRWYLIMALPLGPLLGYALRAKLSVRLRFARCDVHAARTNIPQVLAWGNVLVLRFGHKLVRKVFLYGEPMGTTVLQPQAPASGPAGAGGTPPAVSAPETIPLAESPSPEDATIRHDRPAVFDSDDDASSPMVP